MALYLIFDQHNHWNYKRTVRLHLSFISFFSSLTLFARFFPSFLSSLRPPFCVIIEWIGDGMWSIMFWSCFVLMVSAFEGKTEWRFKWLGMWRNDFWGLSSKLSQIWKISWKFPSAISLRVFSHNHLLNF